MTTTFEQKNVLNHVIPGTAIDPKLQLILINGIYYHYQFPHFAVKAIETHQNYKIIANHGNQLTIEQI